MWVQQGLMDALATQENSWRLVNLGGTKGNLKDISQIKTRRRAAIDIKKTPDSSLWNVRRFAYGRVAC